MVRFCFVCGGRIPEEKLQNKKARFCSDACRYADRRELVELKRAEKRAKGKCGECGRLYRQVSAVGTTARVQEVEVAVG